MKILLADDEKTILITLKDALEKEKYTVITTDNGATAIELLKKEDFDVIIADIRLPGVDGHKILEEAKTICPETEVLLITGYGSIDSAVRAMKSGAYDYITKPFRNEEIVAKLKRIEEFVKMREEVKKLKEEVSSKYTLENIVGCSKSMLEIFELIKLLSKNECSVLIEGESGTGKELVARAIHFSSPRKNTPFVAVSCSAVPETLIESELFGYEKGAFTGAVKQHIGKFERAQQGTIFIDDVDDVSLSLQQKFLRVLENKEIERLGGTGPIKVDVRIIAATKKDLARLVEEKKFREDLYYRLNVVKLYIPPLRERAEDIPLLVEHFIQKYSKGKKVTVPPATMLYLKNYPWPGNVRELEHCIERAIALCGDREELTPQDFFPPFSSKAQELKPAGFVTLEEAVNSTEKDYIIKVLKFTKGRKDEAAKILGISRKTLWSKIKQYNITQ